MFFAAGHGKGPWDGVGGRFKRVLRRETVDLKSMYHCVLKTYARIVAHLRKRFCCEGWDAWETAHGINSSFSVNRVVVHEAGIGEIEQPVVDEEFDSVDGIRKSLGFRALRPGVVVQRGGLMS